MALVLLLILLFPVLVRAGYDGRYINVGGKEHWFTFLISCSKNKRPVRKRESVGRVGHSAPSRFRKR